MAKKKDEMAEWYEEDAQRMNKMCEAAREQGSVIKTINGKPVELNPDGSMKNED